MPGGYIPKERKGNVHSLWAMLFLFGFMNIYKLLIKRRADMEVPSESFKGELGIQEPVIHGEPQILLLTDGSLEMNFSFVILGTSLKDRK